MYRKIPFIIAGLTILCMFLMGAGWDSGSWKNPYENVAGTRLYTYTYSGDVVTDGSFNIPASSDGLGLAKCGATAECLFMVDKDGNVVIAASSDSVSVWNDHEHFCIFDGGDGYATVKNGFGTTYNTEVIYYYK